MAQVPAETRAHIEMLHRCAAAAGCDGKLILFSAGKDPDTDAKIRTKVEHFQIGDIGGMCEAAVRLAGERHRNVYASLAIMRQDLPARQKGKEKDVVAVLGFVADFDKGSGKDRAWAEHCPLPPNSVLRTSPENAQCFFWLDKPRSFAEAKPIAIALTDVARVNCKHVDTAGKDLSHVWRIPGLPNCPTRDKIKAGRAREPFKVEVLEPWDGSFTTKEALLEALGGAAASTPAPAQAKALEYLKKVEIDDLPEKLAKLITEGPPAGTDRSPVAFGVFAELQRLGHGTGDIADVVADNPQGIGERYAGDPEQLTADVLRSCEKAKKTPDWVKDLNNKYFISRHGDDACAFEVKEDPVMERSIMHRISFKGFKKLYDNKRVKTGKNYAPMGTAWLSHPERREYLSGMMLSPGKNVPEGYYNLWTGWGVKPKAGDWSRMRGHIKEVICGGDEKLSAYVIGWLAYAVQYPDRPGEVALVLRGGKGTGKGTFGHYVGRMFGQHYVYISNGKHLTGNFNAHLRDAVFVFADEALFAGDRRNESTLKSMITDPFLTIEGKGRDVVSAKNNLHVLMASNSEWVVPATGNERRFCVLDVSGARRRDEAYFDKIHAEMKGGGLAAMLYDLLEYDLANFRLRDVPQTSALLDQKLETLSGPGMWLFDCLSDGEIAGHSWGEERTEIVIEEAHGAYCSFHRDHTYGGKPRPSSAWGKEIRKMLEDERGRTLIQDGRRAVVDNFSRKNTMFLPPLAAARQAFAFNLGSEIPWEDRPGPHDLTEGIFA